MLLYGVFGLLVLLIVAWMGLAWFGRSQMLEEYGEDQMRKAERWAETPLDVRWDLVPPSETIETTRPRHLISYPSELPHEPDATRRKFFRLMDELSENFFTTLEPTVRPLRDKMTAAADLTPADVDDITTISAKIEPAIALARELAATPGYVHEHPEFWSSDYSYEFNSGLYALQFYTLSQLYLGREKEAVDMADLTANLIRWRGNMTNHRRNDLILRDASGNMSNFALVLDMRTSDSVVLAQALDMLNRQREPLHRLPDAILANLYETIQMFRDAKELGYLPDNKQTNTPTPLMLLAFQADADLFHRWVIKNLEPESGQYNRSIKVLEERRQGRARMTTIDRVVSALFDTFRSPLHVAARPVLIGFGWESYSLMVKSREGTLVTYDLTRLHLARRIAELRGESLPVTEQDFVPKYMPEFPTDPHTGKPYEFSNSEQMFFSAGYDGIPGNENDEKLELPLGIYVPPKSLTPEEEAEAARMFEEMINKTLDTE